MSCKSIEDRLLDGVMDSEVEAHLRVCLECADLTKKLAMLDFSLATTPRVLPPRSLNEELFELLDEESTELNSVPAPQVPTHQNFIRPLLALAAVLIGFFITNLNSENQVVGNLSLIISKNRYELIQLVTLGVGVFVATAGYTKKGVAIALVLVSVIIIQAVKLFSSIR